jgi:hypothetical protein
MYNTNSIESRERGLNASPESVPPQYGNSPPLGGNSPPLSQNSPPMSGISQEAFAPKAMAQGSRESPYVSVSPFRGLSYTGQTPETENSQVGAPSNKHRNYCGMTRTVLVLVLIIILLLVAGAVGGGVGGSLAAKNNSKSAASTSTGSATTSTTSAVPSPSGTPGAITSTNIQTTTSGSSAFTYIFYQQGIDVWYIIWAGKADEETGGFSRPKKLPLTIPARGGTPLAATSYQEASGDSHVGSFHSDCENLVRCYMMLRN